MKCKNRFFAHIFGTSRKVYQFKSNQDKMIIDPFYIYRRIHFIRGNVSFAWNLSVHHRMAQRSTCTSGSDMIHDSLPRTIYQWLSAVFGIVFQPLTVTAIQGPLCETASQNVNRSFSNDISRTKWQSAVCSVPNMTAVVSLLDQVLKITSRLQCLKYQPHVVREPLSNRGALRTCVHSAYWLIRPDVTDDRRTQHSRLTATG